MTLTFHWFLPTSGDSRGIVGGGHGSVIRSGSRTLDLRYLKQLALAAETNDFESVLTPTGAWCEDAWLTDAALIDSTERLKFLVALRPGLVSPTLSAQMAATFQRYSEGRLLINVVTGGEDREQRAFGDSLDKAQRYERCGEFLNVIGKLWRGETVTHHGKHLDVDNGVLNNPPEAIPPIYFGGSSQPAGDVAARYADTYLTWGETPTAVAEKLNWINSLAGEHSRRPEHGIRFHVISRNTSAEAWVVAEKLLAGITPEKVQAAQAGLASSQSEGQRRMSALHGRGNGFTDETTTRDLEVYPNVWDDTRAEAIDDLLDRIDRAYQWTKDNPEEWAKIFAEETGTDAEAAEINVRSSRLPIPLDQTVIDSQNDLIGAFERAEVLPETFDFADQIDVRFED